MTTHSDIMAEFDRQYEKMSEAVEISPSGLAYGVFKAFCIGNEDTRIRYLSLEHLKQMAREHLRRRHDADSDDNPAHRSQGEFLFSGALQPRYPTPRKRGQEPVYKLRSHLSPAERAWNVEQLRKSGEARLEHADALEAEGRGGVAA